MAGEKRFRTSLFGFKKADVNLYIEKMLKELDEKLKEKDDELNALKNQTRDIKLKFEDLARKSDQINEDRIRIADVLIKAQDKADLIIEEAKLEAIEEKKKLEGLVEQEREKLVDIKGEIKGLKVYTKTGQDLGVVNDILFDQKTGTIEGVEVSDGVLQDIVLGRKVVPLFGKVEFSSESMLVDKEALDEMTSTGGGLIRILNKP